mmetsp:Transcript_21327/g.68789  ORF Transcript_21327/g.68789 Transcript_21327/m.68789 type:complete len:346 (+) Transcript_21327:3-1040(+)
MTALQVLQVLGAVTPQAIKRISPPSLQVAPEQRPPRLLVDVEGEDAGGEETRPQGQPAAQKDDRAALAQQRPRRRRGARVRPADRRPGGEGGVGDVKGADGGGEGEARRERRRRVHRGAVGEAGGAEPPLGRVVRGELGRGEQRPSRHEDVGAAPEREHAALRRHLPQRRQPAQAVDRRREPSPRAREVGGAVGSEQARLGLSDARGGKERRRGDVAERAAEQARGEPAAARGPVRAERVAQRWVEAEPRADRDAASEHVGGEAGLPQPAPDALGPYDVQREGSESGAVALPDLPPLLDRVERVRDCNHDGTGQTGGAKLGRGRRARDGPARRRHRRSVWRELRR